MLSYKLTPRTLNFKFAAGTSRGVLKEHQVMYLEMTQGCLTGIGEIAPLPKLSIDFGVDFNEILSKIDFSNQPKFEKYDEVLDYVSSLNLEQFPSLVFALETAFLDLFYGGKKQIFDCKLLSERKGIPINGLVWMNTKEHMLNQVQNKLDAGFRCIKMKIGAIDVQEELEILEFLRESFSHEELVLRVDANGAFNYDKAKVVLKRLEELDVHSIEQPIEKGQECFMKALSSFNKVGVALDEELIGVSSLVEKRKLLDEINPNYIILKPTLLGGMKACLEWVNIAKELRIDWWLTSALESNIGLNAVSQFASLLEVENYQGLGTGQLYHNNIFSPLTIKSGCLYYDDSVSWGEY